MIAQSWQVSLTQHSRNQTGICKASSRQRSALSKISTLQLVAGGNTIIMPE
jgi:hypothetical protein